MKLLINSLPLDAAFGALKIVVSFVAAVHKALLHSQTLLYQALPLIYIIDQWTLQA